MRKDWKLQWEVQNVWRHGEMKTQTCLKRKEKILKVQQSKLSNSKIDSKCGCNIRDISMVKQIFLDNQAFMEELRVQMDLHQLLNSMLNRHISQHIMQQWEEVSQDLLLLSQHLNHQVSHLLQGVAQVVFEFLPPF